MRRSLSILAALALLICACDNTHPDEVILSDATPKLTVRNRTVFEYDPDLCQLSFNRDKCSFRMMTDNMSEFVTVTLDRIPSQEGEKVTASELGWTTERDIESRKNITLEVLKLEGDVIWLWYARESIALVLQVLE